MLALDIKADTLQFHQVRLHGAPDGLQARQRFEAALADFSPSSLNLPPRALLIVNRIAPVARLRLHRTGGGNGFGQAVQAELENKARTASQPWVNSGVANVEAVLFTDETELMACLLRDWLQGSLALRWWWPLVLEGLSAPAWWRRAVLPRGEVLPAVFSLLATQGQAVAWVVRLNESEVSQAITAILAAHAMPSPSVWLHSESLLQESPISRSNSAQTSTPGQSQNLHKPSPAKGSVSDSIGLRRQLVTLVPEVQNHALTIPQRRLLALALGLQRGSSWTRSPAFVVALQTLEISDPVEDEDFGQNRTALPNPSIRLQENQPMLTDFLEAGDKDTASSHAGNFKEKSLPVVRLVEPLNEVQSENISPYTSVPFESSFQIEPPNPPISPKHITHYSNELVTHNLPTIETQFGGLFYLLNVALALELYGDFTQPQKLGIALSSWDFLALIGNAWFGQDFRQDPLWCLFAELAGRSVKETPGCNFTAPDFWIVPDEWLKPWIQAGKMSSTEGEVAVSKSLGDARSLKLYVTPKRLQIWHDAGFILIDVPRIAGVKPLNQAMLLSTHFECLGKIKFIRVHRSPQPAAKRDSLGRWLRWILLYLNARLGRALGNDLSNPLSRFVCCHSAKLYCTATALDIHLALTSLPIEIRIAGLDRNPGWIPAAGRSIAFHFE